MSDDRLFDGPLEELPLPGRCDVVYIDIDYMSNARTSKLKITYLQYALQFV